MSLRLAQMWETLAAATHDSVRVASSLGFPVFRVWHFAAGSADVSRRFAR